MAQQIVALPAYFNTATMLGFFREVLAIDFTPTSSEYVFDFSTLEFIHPAAITGLSNLTELLLSHGCRLIFRYPQVPKKERKMDPVWFLDDSGFFQKYMGTSIYKNPKVRDTTIPLKRIGYEEYVQWVEFEVLPWIDLALGIKTMLQIPELKVCIDETFNNIKDHADKNIASAFMQHYPAKNKIEIAISDFGVGIPSTVRRVKSVATDHHAILEAVNEGFTSKSSPRNRGAGLDTMVGSVVGVNQGFVSIYSYFGKVSCFLSGDRIYMRAEPINFYPGTLIAITMRTDTIPPLGDVEEEFTW